MRVLLTAGARPNFMKIAPLLRELQAQPNIATLLVHTGQHYDDLMSNIFFSELGITAPNLNLNIRSLPRTDQIQKIYEAFLPVVQEYRPDVVVVVGDVNSTVGCAKAAKEMGSKVAHVEAGLRSCDLSMPEELNRLETDKISDLLFVTEQSGMDNLAAEGISGKAFLVGNVMIDTLVYSQPSIAARRIVQELGLVQGQYLVSTFHRPSNVDREEDLQRLLLILRELANIRPLVLPLHPRTEASLEKFGLLTEANSIPRLILIEPLGYFDFLSLVSLSLAVITDSGGIQEETTYLQVPCVTMRENTERPVTTTLGTNVLVGRDSVRLREEVLKIVEGKNKHGQIPPLWDGQAAKRIVSFMRSECAA